MKPSSDKPTGTATPSKAEPYSPKLEGLLRRAIAKTTAKNPGEALTLLPPTPRPAGKP